MHTPLQHCANPSSAPHQLCPQASYKTFLSSRVSSAKWTSASKRVWALVWASPCMASPCFDLVSGSSSVKDWCGSRASRETATRGCCGGYRKTDTHQPASCSSKQILSLGPKTCGGDQKVTHMGKCSRHSTTGRGNCFMKGGLSCLWFMP